MKAAPLSAYFAGRSRSIMIAAYVALGAALTATAAILRCDFRNTLAAVACVSAAWLLIPVAVTTQRVDDVPRSDQARCLHRLTASAAFAAVGGAMASASLSGPLLISFLGVLGTALVVLVLASRPGPNYGLRQKLLLAAVAVWIVAVAVEYP